MQKYAVIVAGGSGKRMGTETPKQFLCFAGKPVLMHTIDRFLEYDSEIGIILVLPKEHHSTWEELCESHNITYSLELISGGLERFHSVLNGLDKVRGDSLVAIHDGVRPLVSVETIKRCFDQAEIRESAIPVMPVAESVRQIDGSDSVMLDRSKIMLVQTPQVFQSRILKSAYDVPFSDEFTDDASVVEKQGKKINLVEGNIENIKITRPIDLQLAGLLYKDISLK